MPTSPAAEPHPTIDAWARRFVTATALATKLDPGPAPACFASGAMPERLQAPGRPEELRVVRKVRRSLSREQVRIPRRRAQLLHTFFHHELQAAELMCWALLAFPGSPPAFRQGLVRICCDEIRHMHLYREQVERLGHQVGDFPVRDWFWQRVAACATPVQFVALMGLGLEGGNLDHADRFGRWFAEAADPDAAGVQAIVGRDEIAHVQFAVHWFAQFTGGVDFDRWARELPPPLSPKLLHGKPLNRVARARAGLPDAFLDALAAS